MSTCYCSSCYLDSFLLSSSCHLWITTTLSSAGIHFIRLINFFYGPSMPRPAWDSEVCSKHTEKRTPHTEHHPRWFGLWHMNLALINSRAIICTCTSSVRPYGNSAAFTVDLHCAILRSLLLHWHKPMQTALALYDSVFLQIQHFDLQYFCVPHPHSAHTHTPVLSQEENSLLRFRSTNDQVYGIFVFQDTTLHDNKVLCDTLLT